MKFKNKEDKLNYILNTIEMNEDISVICNYKTAKEIYYEFIEETYEYVGIDLQSDVGKYLVSLKNDKNKNISFCIEPLKRNNKGNYPMHETKLLLIDKDIWNKEDNDFLDHCDFKDIEMLAIKQEEIFKYKNECKENKNYICSMFDEKENEEDYLENYVLKKLEQASTYEKQIEILKEYGQVKQEDGQQEIVNDVVKLFMDKNINF